MNALITLDALNNIIRSSIERYPRENYGFLYGCQTEKLHDIVNAYHILNVKHKGNTEVEFPISQQKKLWFDLGDELIGSFHSHTRAHGASKRLSKDDLKQMSDGQIYILCGIYINGQKTQRFKKLQDKSLSGVIGSKRIYITAFDGASESPIELNIRGVNL